MKLNLDALEGLFGCEGVLVLMHVLVCVCAWRAGGDRPRA